MIRPLRLGDGYSREDVHGIFSPNTAFTPQAGSWGLHGIVKIPDREKDYVFFVTYGQEQGEHEFDEGITDDGVLSWQSQPSQGLEDRRVIDFINHNDITDNVYLFLREKKRTDYMFYGRLAYLSHDTSREKPVYFQWQLLDWDDLHESENGATFSPPTQVIDDTELSEGIEGVLRLTTEKPRSKKKGVGKEEFRTRKAPDFGERDARNRNLGLVGEKTVLKYEITKLVALGRQDLADKVIHTSAVEGDGAGYDIQSFNSSGELIYIEVKATRGGINSDFFISPNELRFSLLNANSYFLYRLFDFNKSSRDFSFFILQGDIAGACELEPISFRAKIA